MNSLATRGSNTQPCDYGLAVRLLFDIVQMTDLAHTSINCPVEAPQEEQVLTLTGRMADGQAWQAICTDATLGFWWIAPLKSPSARSR